VLASAKNNNTNGHVTEDSGASIIPYCVRLPIRDSLRETADRQQTVL